MARSGARKQAAVVFSVHPAVAYEQAIIAHLPQKTGKSLEEWLALLESDGPTTAKERKQWLKDQHQLGGTTAAMIVGRADGEGWADADTYLKQAAGWVETMFGGPKAGLRPLYEQLLQAGLKLGKDVKVCPCKTIVPLYREHVFAQIKPTTRTRIDLGLALQDTKPTKRLLDTGGRAKGDRITHRIAITTASDIDEPVERWLKTAYDLDG